MANTPTPYGHMCTKNLLSKEKNVSTLHFGFSSVLIIIKCQTKVNRHCDIVITF